MQDRASGLKAAAKKAAHIKALVSKKKASRRGTLSSSYIDATVQATETAGCISSGEALKGIKDKNSIVQSKGRSTASASKLPRLSGPYLNYAVRSLRRETADNRDREECPTDRLENAALDAAAVIRFSPGRMYPSNRKAQAQHETKTPTQTQESRTTSRKPEEGRRSQNTVSAADEARPGSEIKDRQSHHSGAVKTREEVQKRAVGSSFTEGRRAAAAKAKAVGNAKEKAVARKIKSDRLRAAMKKAGKAAADKLFAAAAILAAVMLPLLVVMAVGGLMYGSDEHSAGTEEISEEVHELSPYIFAYACEYGLEEYISLIKAVMMQESGGRGEDPMQSSECSYNTKYPQSPNGITDPEYSIDVGIQYLKDCIELAGVEDPNDIEQISLALQGYNFGIGYISWAKAKYGGYSELNAMEFSEYMAEQMGWEGYGDPYYVSHVLRYYSVSEE